MRIREKCLTLGLDVAYYVLQQISKNSYALLSPLVLVLLLLSFSLLCPLCPVLRSVSVFAGSERTRESTLASQVTTKWNRTRELHVNTTRFCSLSDLASFASRFESRGGKGRGRHWG